MDPHPRRYAPPLSPSEERGHRHQERFWLLPNTVAMFQSPEGGFDKGVLPTTDNYKYPQRLSPFPRMGRGGEALRRGEGISNATTLPTAEHPHYAHASRLTTPSCRPSNSPSIAR